MSQLPQFNALQQAAYQLASCTDNLFQQIEQEQVLDSIIQQIRACLEIEDLFRETSRLIRQLLKADRVAVFRFTPGTGWDEGEFVAEDVVKDFSSAMAARVYDHCFGEQYAHEYINGRVQAVADIYNANLSDCHIQILERFNVKANLIVPVLKGKELWGLLCVHQCAQPRHWQLSEIGFVQKIATHFAVALQQSQQLEQIKAQASLLIQTKAKEQAFARQKSLVKIVSKIRLSFDFTEICNTTTDEVRKLLESDRVAIYRFNKDWSGEFSYESVADGWEPLVGITPSIEDTYLAETEGGRYAKGEMYSVSDIYAMGYDDCHIELLETFQAKAYALAPIFQDSHLWGLICAYQNSGPRDWQTDEMELLAQVGEQLGIALQQADKQNKAIERQKTLVKIVSKIRQSLELKEVCLTATDEVRHLLAADRVAVYGFHEDWSGEFLFESVADGWNALAGVTPPITDTHLTETEGGRYAQGETFSVPDIYAMGYDDCHIELLEMFQAKAYAIVPIFQDEHLWGLLCAYQNTGPRNWKADELELLAQIGEQIGIALQQTEYVRKLQAKSVELEALFEALKKSQLQLVQNEKMASLGQLVAGVAHEINNPINFIHGNLPHVNGYTNDLLNLARIYQETDLDSPGDRQNLEEEAEDLDLDFIAEDLPKVLASMKMGTDRIRQIVLSLRNFSRLDEAEYKDVNIHDGIDSTLIILGNRLKFSDGVTAIKLEKDYGEIPLVECFPAQLNQVFMNILSNAIDALEEMLVNGRPDNWAPQIWINTERNGKDGIQIRIRDNGAGIKETDERKVFDPFFTTKSIGKGTGLGLSISHEIITQKHGGQLTFATGEQGGTEFKIQLPIKCLASS